MITERALRRKRKHQSAFAFLTELSLKYSLPAVFGERGRCLRSSRREPASFAINALDHGYIGKSERARQQIPPSLDRRPEVFTELPNPPRRRYRRCRRAPRSQSSVEEFASLLITAALRNPPPLYLSLSFDVSPRKDRAAHVSVEQEN